MNYQWTQHKTSSHIIYYWKVEHTCPYVAVFLSHNKDQMHDIEFRGFLEDRSTQITHFPNTISIQQIKTYVEKETQRYIKLMPFF